MKKLLLPFALAACALPAQAQLLDNFSDGDFSQTPAWTGDAASFQVISQQLQSSGAAVTGTTLQLVTPVQTAGAVSWEFWANLRLATSSGNYADVWLMSEQADLKATGNRGYFVRLGGTPDEVALFRKDATGSPVYVVNGADAALNSSTNNLVRVRVTRSAQDVWTLERDLTGGSTYVSEGTATDATLRRGAYFGVQLTYSAANNRAFYFDEFRVTDTAAPQPLTATIAAARQLNVTFNEPVAATQLASNYRLGAPSAPAILNAQRDATDPTLVHLTLAADLPTGASTLEIRNSTDLYGNTAASPFTLSLQNNGVLAQPTLNQVLITEILADETPAVGLPASEYVEIHNPSATATLDLAGMRLLKPGSSNPAVFPVGAVLLPGEYAVVCGSTRAAQFSAFGKVFGLSNFPSLTNAADQLLLRGRNGQMVFEVSYSDTWYKDSRKKEGGWSLEMVDTANPCAGLDNWTASTDASGGTPGRANSVRTSNADRTAPKLLRALAVNATTVRLFFGEKLDSVAAANPALYTLMPAVAITRAAPVGPDFRAVDLTLSAALQANQPLTATVQRATDCVGNATGQAASVTFGLPVPVAAGDVVINEILFNPRTNAVDFVELLNRSTKYLDVQGWHLGNEKPDGTLDQEVVSNSAYVLAPGQLLLLTTRPDVVQSQYPTSTNPEAFLLMTSFPTYPDDAGNVVVADAQGRVLDRYAYAEEQHLKLLDDVNGVSLERLRADAPSVASNFHSAASAAGYATPGRPNSQLQQDPGGGQQFRLTPEIFTPDEDGQQDYTTLNYTLDSPGYAASVTVYDAQGRLARRLVRNETLATSGFFQWDGLTDRGQKAAVGYYILLIELFKPNSGEKREYKKTVVLGARF
ncbi:lamin tail domain-containing protein [Hymenobacter sp. BT186]|uniref:Lamin tail domain-containing protein n=1 Tax=Hymenobacter telluris TaxID=2816474 RepID=A0A939JB79_9BACT|nr:lamin tail domain-containing protein [Hymenobacter telluris]MBO0357040.1 lamin tail domain-containing protein [Hymenobacter telluris]MBW3373067.1 lamin tail domain-containing protein [Hymenobacter norwichensis]